VKTRQHFCFHVMGTNCEPQGDTRVGVGCGCLEADLLASIFVREAGLWEGQQDKTWTGSSPAQYQRGGLGPLQVEECTNEGI